MSSPSGTPASSSTAAAGSARDVSMLPFEMLIFDARQNRWVPGKLDGGRLSTSSTSSTTSSPPAAVVRVATLNVLTCRFPGLVRLAIDSTRRFDALVAEIEKVNADVICLNEVDSDSYAVILQSDIARYGCRRDQDQQLQPYAISPLVPTNFAEHDFVHGCVVLSRLPVVSSGWILGAVAARPPVVITLNSTVDPSLPSKCLTVCAVHTTAYQTARSRAMRAEQITTVTRALQQYVAKEKIGESYVICGDLNLHDDAEDAVLLSNKLLDLWLECILSTGNLNDAITGYTFDPSRNSMIAHYIPGETRCMRLDRMLLNEGALWQPWSPAPAAAAAAAAAAEISSSASSPSSSPSSSFSSTTTTPSSPVMSMWANTTIDAYRELFISDHFGLVVNLQPTDDTTPRFTGSSRVRALQKKRAESGLSTNTPSKLHFALSLPRHVGWLLGRAIGVW